MCFRKLSMRRKRLRRLFAHMRRIAELHMIFDQRKGALDHVIRETEAAEKETARSSTPFST